MEEIEDVISIHQDPIQCDREFEALYRMEEETAAKAAAAAASTTTATAATAATPSIGTTAMEVDEEEAPEDGEVSSEMSTTARVDARIEEDEDNVIVTIDLPGRDETERLRSLIDADPLNTIPIICNKNYSYHVFDLEIEKELERLIRLSICPSTQKHVVILVNNQLVLVPHNVRLSDRLIAYVWGANKLYAEYVIPYVEEFNRLLQPNAKYRDTFAIFGARYNNTQYVRGSKNVCGLHQYSEFAAIVIANGRLVDCAIHGYKSDIEKMIQHHRPRRVYYNAKNESLTHFLEYECQPFFRCSKDILRPIQIHEPANFNTLPFCERRDVFCALCRCLKDALSFMNYAKVPSTVKIPQRLHDFVPVSTEYRRRRVAMSSPSTASRRKFFVRQPFDRRWRHCAAVAGRTNRTRASSSECVKLVRVRNNNETRYRRQRNKRKMISFNSNLEF